ncbi:MAG: TAT-variant-translocated molybdopterin oxidoreductase [Bacteriovoracia bacterium]
MSNKFWMTLEQAENPAEFAKTVPGEFTSTPVREGNENDGLDRRDFMKIMGASALMASLAGCSRRPVQKIVPYVTNPEEIIPGQPNFYASADPQTGYGLLIKTREGRPIKVDGNTDHPMNRGALHTRAQAMIHDLYDPDRLRAPRIGGAEVSWADFDKQARAALGASKGATWILTGTVMSPTLKRVIEKNNFRHVMLDSVSMDDVLDGQAQSYGSRIFPRYRFNRADCVVSIDADFLGNWGSTTEYTKQFADKRRLAGEKSSMSKLIAFESAFQVTGQNADERYAIHPNDQLFIALGIASEVARLVGRSSDDFSAFTPAAVSQRTGIDAAVLSSTAKELVKNRGRSLVVASGRGANGVALQNVVNFLNSALDNDGVTVDGSTYPSYQFQGSYKEFEKLLTAIRSGAVKTLIIQGVNPAYLFADSAGVKEALQKVPNLIYVGSYSDETAAIAKMVAAESHSFESWGDVNPQKDLYSIAQPTIRPLWQTKSLLEMLVDWSTPEGKESEGAYGAVVETWKGLHSKHGGGRPFQDWWDDTLMGGVLNGSSSRDGSGSSRGFQNEGLRTAIAAAKASVRAAAGELALVLVPSIALGDGFQANNAILQELPDPISKNTWGNYLAVAPDTAKKMGWAEGDVVSVSTANAKAELPLYFQPGLHPSVVVSYLGYGRKFNGRIGNGVGASFANFTASSTMGTQPTFAVNNVTVAKTGRAEKLACTQGHHTLEGRDIVFETTLDDYRKKPNAGITKHFAGEKPPSLWSGFEYKGYKWGMAIDLSSCTGCSACVVACSVENNVPAVGKDQVQKGREMQWLRIDRYYVGDVADPEVVFQPMLCQHCDNAPCETVCPVLATTHSDDGLNQMTYNRCVGTKYCSNNCPYKVRRFNWFNNNGDMNGSIEHPLPLMKNPEVTLRSRGVMEKCTFCVQRIETGKSQAKMAGRRANDDDIKTACQEACPADAIVFGDVNNPESKVAKLKKGNPRGFVSLEEVNAAPAITYLSKVRNRPGKAGGESHGHEETTSGGHH